MAAIDTDCDDDLVRPKAGSAGTEEIGPPDDLAAKASGSLGVIGPVPAAELVYGVLSVCAAFNISDENCGEQIDSSNDLVGVSLFVDFRSFDPFLAEVGSDFFGMVASGSVSVLFRSNCRLRLTGRALEVSEFSSSSLVESSRRFLVDTVSEGIVCIPMHPRTIFFNLLKIAFFVGFINFMDFNARSLPPVIKARDVGCRFEWVLFNFSLLW